MAISRLDVPILGPLVLNSFPELYVPGPGSGSSILLVPYFAPMVNAEGFLDTGLMLGL